VPFNGCVRLGQQLKLSELFIFLQSMPPVIGSVLLFLY
jgi:hypothetical protein